jgi:hypothetical protein
MMATIALFFSDVDLVDQLVRQLFSVVIYSNWEM